MENSKMTGEKKEKTPGERLRELRANKSQTTVANDIGVPQTVLSSWENDERQPRDDKKKLLAEYYGVTVGSIFFGE
jgi:transcriptional regulator with XRE-family HTH domain